MTQIASPIDSLIEHLKGLDPFNDITAYRLWESLQLLAGDLNRLIKSVLISEIPTGRIDGINRTFNISQVPTDNFMLIFQNGLLVTTYTINNQVITMNSTPSINDTLIVVYRKAGI